ncbi:MAG: hypothetical protein ACI9XK_000722 [Granulosicoccus sp.]|jgi:hypothetical protein
MNKEQAHSAEITSEPEVSPGFFKRHRLPLFLAVVALSLYAGSILYMLYGKGGAT